jgi:integrase
MPSITFKFTSASIHKHLTSTPNSTILRDEVLNGLIIRRTSTGEGRFAVEKKLDGKLHKQVLWTLAENQRLDDARAKASEIFLSLRDGVDPRRTANLNTLTTRTVDDWLDLHKSVVRASTHRQNLHVIKKLGVGSKRLLLDFTPSDGFALFDAARKAGAAASTAALRLSVLRLLWNYAAERADIETRCPFDRVLKGLRSPPPRNQYVPLKDLPKLLEAVRLRSGVGADAIEVLVLTGLRFNEVLQMTWSEIDFDTGTLNLSVDRMKTGVALKRPLTKRVLQILDARPRNGQFVFKSAQTGVRAPTKTAPRTVLNYAGKTVGIAALRPHDLRRSFITASYELGIGSEFTRMLVSHSAGMGAHAGYIMRNEDALRLAAQTIEDGILAL